MLHRQNELGLSLIELCAVIAITGILATAGIHAYRASALAGAVRYEADQLTLELESATSLSLSTRTPLFASVTADQVTLADREGTSMRSFRLDSRLSHTWQFGTVTGVENSQADKEIAFYPSGAVTPGRVTIASPYGHRCIVIQSIRGRRTLECLQ